MSLNEESPCAGSGFGSEILFISARSLRKGSACTCSGLGPSATCEDSACTSSGSGSKIFLSCSTNVTSGNKLLECHHVFFVIYKNKNT